MKNNHISKGNIEYSLLNLSKILGVTPKTIERWHQQGRLPLSIKDSKNQIRISELKKWASSHGICLNLSGQALHEKQTESIIPLSDAIQNGDIYFNIQGTDVNGILKDSVDHISGIPEAFKADLVDRLIEREHSLSTGIGNGIAIPHPREPLSYLKQPMITICFPEKPVEYHAIDHEPVSVIFFLLCPSLKTHLHLLSGLSFCLRNNPFVHFLKTKPEPAHIIKEIEVLQKENAL